MANNLHNQHLYIRCIIPNLQKPAPVRPPPQAGAGDSGTDDGSEGGIEAGHEADDESDSS